VLCERHSLNRIIAEEAPMEFPEIITRLPEAAIPFPSSVVKTSLLQSENGQLVFSTYSKLWRYLLTVTRHNGARSFMAS
jgi:hypothetical protein